MSNGHDPDMPLLNPAGLGDATNEEDGVQNQMAAAADVAQSAPQNHAMEFADEFGADGPKSLFRIFRGQPEASEHKIQTAMPEGFPVPDFLVQAGVASTKKDDGRGFESSRAEPSQRPDVPRRNPYVNPYSDDVMNEVNSEDVCKDEIVPCAGVSGASTALLGEKYGNPLPITAPSYGDGHFVNQALTEGADAKHRLMQGNVSAWGSFVSHGDNLSSAVVRQPSDAGAAQQPAHVALRGSFGNPGGLPAEQPALRLQRIGGRVKRITFKQVVY
jgi:hypothetical protein